jgi:hypothetical protein
MLTLDAFSRRIRPPWHSRRVNSACVKEVSDAGPLRDGAAYSATGVRKPPREKTALGERKGVPQALWGI